jgi:hypothetical protein
MAEDLQIKPHVVEEILNHVSYKSGVAKRYNKASYEADKREALRIAVIIGDSPLKYRSQISAADVLAVHLEQVECAEDGAGVGSVAANEIEHGKAVVVANDRLAIDYGRIGRAKPRSPLPPAESDPRSPCRFA